MNRKIVIGLLVAISCITGLFLSYYMMHNSRVGSAVSRIVDNEKPVNDNLTKNVQSVYDLPTRMAVVGKEEFTPCYFDEENKILYRWKGVVLRDDQVKQTPYGGSPSGFKLLPAGNLSSVLVDAPIKYWQVGKIYRPGYLDRTVWTFYAWKGVELIKEEVLDKSQDGQIAIVNLAFQSQGIQLIEIEMPAHLIEKQALWKKSL